MNNYVITTDYTSDQVDGFYERTGIERVILPVDMAGKTYDCRTSNITAKDFYQKMRDGATASTSQVSQFDAMEIFSKHLEKGEDILHFCFSSGCSSSFDNFTATVNELKEKFPDRRVEVIDTLAGSGALGIMVDIADKMKRDGKSLDDVKNWIEENKLKFNHYFIVDDLANLKRGGRLSRIEAALGTVLGIKPVLILDKDGKISAIAKVRGKKKAYQAMIDSVVENIDKDNNDYILMTHGDCPDVVEEIGNRIEELVGIDVKYTDLDYVIGAHAGPDVVAVFFIGKDKRNK